MFFARPGRGHGGGFFVRVKKLFSLTRVAEIDALALVARLGPVVFFRVYYISFVRIPRFHSSYLSFRTATRPRLQLP